MSVYLIVKTTAGPNRAFFTDGEVVLGEIQTAISRQKGPAAQGHPGDEQQGRYEKDGHENDGRRRIGDAHQLTVSPRLSRHRAAGAVRCSGVAGVMATEGALSFEGRQLGEGREEGTALRRGSARG